MVLFFAKRTGQRRTLMKKKKKKPFWKRSEGILLIYALIILAIFLICITIVSIANKKDKEPVDPGMIVSQSFTDSSEESTEESKEASTEETKESQTLESTEESSGSGESSSAEESKTRESSSEELPPQVMGKWDLSTLSNEKTPFGNNPNDRDENGVPVGVYWYKNKWGKYHVDFISERTNEKVLYLTMDCGFDNPETEKILDILKEKDVKATFFVTSMFYDARPDLIKRMIDEGHRIGSHSINHKNMPDLSLETQRKEIMDVVDKLKKDYNYDCRLFRFPEGMFSDQSLALVDNLGLKSVFWSYAYNDYSATQPEVQPSYEKAVKYLHPGAIYLLHASSSTNRAFLADWIDEARRQGYEFAGVYPVD